METSLVSVRELCELSRSSLGDPTTRTGLNHARESQKQFKGRVDSIGWDGATDH